MTMAENSLLDVIGLGHSYGEKRVIRDISFSLGKGEFLSIVGPSGAGKTTLLQCLSGLRKPSEGTIIFEGTAISGPPDDMTVVFQDYSRSLMPWLTVLANVTLPLRSRGVSKQERNERARKTLADVGLAGAEDNYPWQLSGGMQQRVAIARALVGDPAAIVMDEPFASVDAQTRADLEDLVLRLGHSRGVTILLVTHDIDESVYLADKVLVISGSPATVAALIPVSFEGKRDQITTKATPEFARLRSEVYGLIKASKALASTPSD
jgi:NitT/TauT family transport system ATP-binding protein